MKRVISRENPFGLTPKGLAFEIVKDRGVRGAHLDYGAHNGDFLEALSKAGFIASAVGVDVNVDVVRKFQPLMPANVKLECITKHAPLPFPPNSFDSMSIIGVVEHVHDQTKLLSQLAAALKPGGYIVIAVPGQHVFSALDMGNWKFRFPALHRVVYTMLHSREDYHRRYVECRNGLFGDIEVEKMWHEHFSIESMGRLLATAGLKIADVDGQGLFQRILINVAYFAGGRNGPLKSIIDFDAQRFGRCELVFVAQHS